MKIKLNEAEKQIIMKHEPAARSRVLLEMEIVCALIRQAAQYDYYFEVENTWPTTDDDIKKVLFDYDDASIVIYDEKGNNIGWIKLAFGHNGYDLISDYSTNLETFLEPVNAIAEFWGG